MNAKKPPAYSSELGYNCPSGCFAPMATCIVYAIPIQVSSNLKMQQSACRFTIDARVNREHWNRNEKSLETVDTQRLQGFSLVIHRRFELRTPWLKVKCSTDWANGSYPFRCAEAVSANQLDYHIIFARKSQVFFAFSSLCFHSLW